MAAPVPFYSGGFAEWTLSTGTGDYVLRGALPEYAPFSAKLTDGATGTVRVTNGAQTEICSFAWDAETNTLARGEIAYPPSGAVNWGPGRKLVYLELGNPADYVPATTVVATGGDSGDDVSTADFSPNNIIHWGHVSYPFDYGFAGGPNTYWIGDAGDDNSDVSFVMRNQGNARFEFGMVGAVTDGDVNQSLHLKEISGLYRHETFTDRLILWAQGSPRYPFFDIFAGETAENSYFRVYPGGSDGNAVLILGNATYGFPGRTGEGLTIAWEVQQIARFSSATWGAFYRDIVFEGNRIRFTTGPVFLQDSLTIDDKGAALFARPVRQALFALVSNAGQAGIALMSGYVPGVDIIHSIGGAGKAPFFLVETTQVSHVNSIVSAGTGGTNSTATTLSAPANSPDTSIGVVSVTGFSVGDVIDIKFDGGGYLERTIANIVGTTISFDVAVDASCSAGNAVYKAQTVAGTTGAGTMGTFSVRIAAGGLAEVLQIHGGSYTTNPTTLTNEPVSGAGLSGAALDIDMGALGLSTYSPGALTTTPNTPVSTLSNAGGIGLTIDITYVDRLGDLNLAGTIYENGVAFSGGQRLLGFELANPRIVFVGDSLTAGYNGQYFGTRYNDYLTISTFESLEFVPINIGVASRKLQTMDDERNNLLATLYWMNAAANVAVVWGGIIDLFFGTSAATLYGIMETFCNHLKAVGWNVIVCTLTSCQNFDTEVNDFNTALQGDFAFADGLADLAADARIGGTDAWQDTAYFSTDGIHLTDAGYQVVAEIVGAAITDLVDLLTPGFAPPSRYLAGSVIDYTNGAGVAAGTLTNAPVAGNPTKWLLVKDGQTIRRIPAW